MATQRLLELVGYFCLGALEICHILLEEFRQCEGWTALEQRYEAVGGNIYSPDDNEWEEA
jgi:hypothetical protein